jgi:hypothetical protein
MRLPNGDKAIIEIAKLREYCLSATHPRGKHKARVFQSALGISAEHAEELRDRLLAAASNEDAIIGDSDRYGIRYIIDSAMIRRGHSAVVRSCWIILNSDSVPRFVTCFVL